MSESILFFVVVVVLRRALTQLYNGNQVEFDNSYFCFHEGFHN